LVKAPLVATLNRGRLVGTRRRPPQPGTQIFSFLLSNPMMDISAPSNKHSHVVRLDEMGNWAVDRSKRTRNKGATASGARQKNIPVPHRKGGDYSPRSSKERQGRHQTKQERHGGSSGLQ